MIVCASLKMLLITIVAWIISLNLLASVLACMTILATSPYVAELAEIAENLDTSSSIYNKFKISSSQVMMKGGSIID